MTTLRFQPGSTTGPREHFHQFRNLPPLIVLVAAGNGLLDAVGNVIVQDFLFNPAQRCAHGGDLGDDIDTVAVLLNHAGKASHLAFDAVEALGYGFLSIFAHVLTYTLWGYMCQCDTPRGYQVQAIREGHHDRT